TAASQLFLWQTVCMARGWESKDVESQMEATGTAKAKPEKKDKTADDQAREQERRGLLLSRTRIANDLQSPTHPNHPQPPQTPRPRPSPPRQKPRRPLLPPPPCLL